jgi:hypothetical protein
MATEKNWKSFLGFPLWTINKRKQKYSLQVKNPAGVLIGEIRPKTQKWDDISSPRYEIRDDKEEILASIHFFYKYLKKDIPWRGITTQELFGRFYIETPSGVYSWEWYDDQSVISISVTDSNNNRCFSLERQKKRFGALSTQAKIYSKGILSPELTCFVGMCIMMSTPTHKIEAPSDD